MEYRKLLIPLILIILISGCQQKEDPLADHSFLTQEPCKAPCWYGLALNESGEEDVLQTIKSLPFVDPTSVRTWNTIWNNDQNAVEIIFNCLHPELKSCGGATVSQNKLQSVFLIITYPLSIQSVIEIYGTPDFIGFRGFHPETGGCILDLYWPKQEIIVTNSNKIDDRICKRLDKEKGLTTSTQITEVTYIINDKLKFQEGSPNYLLWSELSIEGQ